MATVKTDDRYYAAIAEAIRAHKDPMVLGDTYKPSEMAGAINSACLAEYNKGMGEGQSFGYALGLDDGCTQGREAERTERDAKEAQYLSDINTKVTAYGVNEAETLSDVPQSIDSVHAKGVSTGEESGYTAGHAAGVTVGAQSEHDRFWDAFQDCGNRTDYTWAFRHWNTDYIRPKYKVQNITMRSDSFFQYSKVKKIEAAYFDFTGINELTGNPTNGATYAMFNACRQLEEIEDLNIPAGTYYGTWNNCVSLKKIAVVRCMVGKAFTMAFNNCTALEDVTFIGTMSTNGLDLQYSTKLSKASIESVIGVLSATTSGFKITLSKTAVNRAFETSSGANDGVSSAEWAALIATKSNWTISLV